MAELTILESKLAEVLGLASAAKGATEKVEGMLDERGTLTLRRSPARSCLGACVSASTPWCAL